MSLLNSLVAEKTKVFKESSVVLDFGYREFTTTQEMPLFPPELPSKLKQLLVKMDVTVELGESFDCYMHTDNPHNIFMLPFGLFTMYADNHQQAMESYVSTLCHELIHITGCVEHLDRNTLKSETDGVKRYQEELIAMIGEVTLPQKLGIPLSDEAVNGSAKNFMSHFIALRKLLPSPLDESVFPVMTECLDHAFDAMNYLLTFVNDCDTTPVTVDDVAPFMDRLWKTEVEIETKVK